MLHRMAAYCSASERCVDDVKKKMVSAGLPADAQERIIQKLVSERYIDEARYARFFANDKLRFNKWGRIRIRLELQRKRIPEQIREEVTGELDEQLYRSILTDLLKGKKKSVKGKDEREIGYKLFRFAVGRGFESDVIRECLKTMGSDGEYEAYPD